MGNISDHVLDITLAAEYLVNLDNKSCPVRDHPE